MNVESIIEQLLFSTVRIQTNDNSVGTGFLLQAQLTSGGSVIFLITNKHVIKNANEVKFFLTKAEKVIQIEKIDSTFTGKIKSFFSGEKEYDKRRDTPKLGYKHEVSLKIEGWFDHPDDDIDLTLINLSPTLNEFYRDGQEPFIRTIPLESIPPKEELEKLDALEEIIFIGYPTGIFDTKNLFPIIRKGITATPIYADFCDKPLFLIDASVFPGSSGSPVFIYNKSGYSDKQGNVFIGGGRAFFCGVISSGYFRNEEGNIEFKEIPTKIQPILKKSEMIDLGIVIKSEKVKELLNFYLKDYNKRRREMYGY